MLHRNLRSMLRKVPSKSLLRSIHTSTQKPNPSHLLSNSQAQYQAMSVNSLKAELKTRGLRVSGRKADLVDRLATYDARRSFSATPQPAKKGDDSHIDFFHVPEKQPEQTISIVRIPIVPDNKTVAKDVEMVEPTIPAQDAASTTAAVNSVGGRTVSSMNTDMGDAAAEEVHDNDYEPNTEVSGRDKTILAGLAAGIAAFWAGDSLWKKSKK